MWVKFTSVKVKKWEIVASFLRDPLHKKGNVSLTCVITKAEEKNPLPGPRQR